MAVFGGDWAAALIIFGFVVVFSIIACHAIPGPLKPGDPMIWGAIAAMGGLTAVITALVWASNPYPYGILYSGTLMIICVECWYTEDPQLINGSKTRGWPFFLFHRPGAEKTMAISPMTSYTRIFSAWHAGGVCLSFFMHVVAQNFPLPEQAVVSLALGLLWVIWAATNQWRFFFGGAQFCQVSIAFHGSIGPGCGLNGYWHLSYWLEHRKEAARYETEELILLATFAVFVVGNIIWFVAHAQDEDWEAPTDKPSRRR